MVQSEREAVPRSHLPRLLSIQDPSVPLEAYVAVDADEDYRGLTFGGLRIAPTVDGVIMSALAHCMTAKFRMHGVPIRGAKAGIRASQELGCTPEIAAAFANASAALLRSQVIVGKDLGASDAFMDACYEALGQPQLQLARERGYVSCPDKVRSLNGYREHMTGLGVAWSADEALRTMGGSAKGARVLVQGSGRVGLGTAVRLVELGAVIVGMNDRRHAVYSEAGLPIAALTAAIDSDRDLHPTRLAVPHAVLERDALLGLDADVLVLAADSRIVDAQAAEGIRAPLIVEGANFPCTDGATEVLRRRGVPTLPGVIASSSSAAIVGLQITTGNTSDPVAAWARIEANIRAVIRETLAGLRPGETVDEAFYRLQGMSDG